MSESVSIGLFSSVIGDVKIEKNVFFICALTLWLPLTI